MLRTGTTGCGRRAAPVPRTAGITDPGVAEEFGPETEHAVREFQVKRGLRVDGVCGPETWNALVESCYRLGDRLLYPQSPFPAR